MIMEGKGGIGEAVVDEADTADTLVDTMHGHFSGVKHGHMMLVIAIL
jgi:hypothetical protein